MIINLKINKQTLEVEKNDETIFINNIKDIDNIIEIEISKPEPEIKSPWLP